MEGGASHLDELKLFSEGRAAHRTVPAWVWAPAATAFANLEEFTLLVSLIPIYQCKLVSWPSRI